MSKYDLKSKFKLELFKKYVKELIEDEEFVELRKIKMKRNLDQNGLYWVWLTCLHQETGIPKDQWHIVFRAKYLRKSDEFILKYIKPKVWVRAVELIEQYHYEPAISQLIDLIAKSTSDLEENQFAEYLTLIKDYAYDEHNITLLSNKDPNFGEFQKEYYRHI